MRVGEENKGWDVAKFLLGNERTGIARLGKSKERVKFAKEQAKEMRADGRPLIEDPEFRRRIALLETELKSLEITQLRVLSAQKAGERRQDPLTAVLKLKGTELLQATTELAMDVGGPLVDAGLGGRIGGAQQRARTGSGLGHRGDPQLSVPARRLDLWRHQRDHEEHRLEGRAGAVSTRLLVTLRETRARPGRADGQPGSLDSRLSRE